MTAAWGTTTLGSAGKWVSGGTPSTSIEEYWGGDIPWMSSKSLTEFRVRDSDRRLTTLGAENGTKLVPKDTILMVVRGMSLKSEFRMGITQRQVGLSQDLKALIPRDDLDPVFLAYALQSRTEEVLDMVDEAGHGTGRLQTDRLFALELPVPPLAVQQSIAATLGVLDDKIESNRRTRELELGVAIAVLSTGSRRLRLGDVAELTKGLSYKGAGLNDGSSPYASPMLNLANFTTTGDLKLSGMKFYTGDFKPKHRLSAWDLVIANTDLTQLREILGRGFLVPPSLDEALHTHHTSRVRFFDNPELAPVVWAQLQSPAFRERAVGFATGTTVTSLPAEAVLDFEFALPDELERALLQARTLIAHSWQADDESLRLAALRDALLSELLSGRVRISSEEFA